MDLSLIEHRLDTGKGSICLGSQVLHARHRAQVGTQHRALEWMNPGVKVDLLFENGTVT